MRADWDPQQPRQWSYTTDAGATEQWLFPDESYTGDVHKYRHATLLRDFFRSVSQKRWKTASQHYAGGGLEPG
eukprot:5832514-Pyramimonas_sp.AAC.1